jgi:hypothetical protein
MPSNKSFLAILRIRDFIENVEPDSTRPGKGLSVQLRVSLNIPSEDIQSDDVEQNEIPTLIRFFNEGNRPDLYQTNAFVFSSGFLTTSSDDEYCTSRSQLGSVDWRCLFQEHAHII